MRKFIYTIMQTAGYGGIFFLIALENIFPPIPSELILTLGGFMTTTTELSLIIMIVCATLGSLIGALLLYYVGRLMGIERLEHMAKRHKLLGIKPDHIQKANRLYSRHQKKAVFFCRMIPLVRSLISIPAGIAGMELGTFIILTAFGSLIWNTILIVLGAILGEAFPVVVQYLKIYSHITYAVLSIGLLIIITIALRKKQKSKKATKSAN